MGISEERGIIAALSTMSRAFLTGTYFAGCCPTGNPFERSLKRFLQTNLGEVEDN